MSIESDDTDANSAVSKGDHSGGKSGELLYAKDLHVTYGKVAALQGINLSIDEGEIVGLIGPNGAGKTTLADTVSGFLPYEGRVTFKGRNVNERKQPELVDEGMIYCTEQRDLFGFMSVEQNLKLGRFSRRGESITDPLEFVYDLFPRLEERREQDAQTMSGGEQQMLAIGRALMGDPDLLILDEPAIGLAPVVLEDISQGLNRIMEENPITVLLTEQNITFAFRHADRLALLENGEIVRRGTPDELEGDTYIRESYLGG